jgi:hypothetical protein
MGRRKEPRLAGHISVSVHVIGGQAGSTISGEVTDLSGVGMGLTIPNRIEPGTALRVETDSLFLVGTCCRCEPEGEAFHIGVMLRHCQRKR